MKGILFLPAQKKKKFLIQFYILTFPENFETVFFYKIANAFNYGIRNKNYI